jgi:myo-inositol-1(or 4)-monophosphatase
MALDHGNLSRLLETAIVAARLAGQRAMEEMDFVKASVKNDTDHVTQADLRCQGIIVDRIKQAYPDHGFIAEEGEGGGIFKQPPRGSEDIWWVVDPIDGTANFVHGIPSFTVCIAAMHGGRPVVGAVFEPATDSMFTAVAGGEAQLNGRRIAPGTAKMDRFSSVGIDSYYNEGVPDWVCHVIQHTRSRNFGTTGLHLAYVARGAMVAAVASRPKLWDIAAGAVIAETAGAVVTGWKGEKLFPMDLQSYKGREINTVAANKMVHSEMLELLNK